MPPNPNCAAPPPEPAARHPAARLRRVRVLDFCPWAERLQDAAEFLIGLLDEHVIPSYSLNSNNVLRLTPPAILDAADLDWLGRALTSAARHASRVVSLAA